MRNEKLENYYFITTGTPLLESGLHQLQTGMDFTLIPCKELVVRTGMPKTKINLGFNKKTERHLTVLRIAYKLFKHLEKTEASFDEINRFFEPSGYAISKNLPNIEAIANISELEFNQLYVAGTGKSRMSVAKLYNIAANFLEYNMVNIGGDIKKKRTNNVEQIEISLELMDRQVEETISMLLGEFLDDGNLIELLDYCEIELTNKPRTNINPYVLYKGEVGDKRLTELLRFSKANISLNSKGLLMADNNLHKQTVAMYFEGEPSKDTHILLGDESLPEVDMLKAFLWLKDAAKEEILYNALSNAPLLDELPKGLYFPNEEAASYDEDLDDLEFSYQGIDDIGIVEDLDAFSTPYKDLFKEVKFSDVREVLNNSIVNGFVAKYNVVPSQTRTIKEIVMKDHRILGLDEVDVREVIIGLSGGELIKAMNDVADNVKKVAQELDEMASKLSQQLEQGGFGSIDSIMERKTAGIERVIGKIGEGINLPLLCSDKSEQQIHNEILGLTSPGYEDGMLSRDIRENQIANLKIWGEEEELIGGVKIPKPLLQHLLKGTKQVVEELLNMTITANRNEFVKEYMELTDTDDEEVMVSKLVNAYNKVF